MKRTLSLLIIFFLSYQLSYGDSYSISRVNFGRGELAHTWSGIIYNGEKSFVLRLGKGQSLKVGGDDVYSWSVKTPSGSNLGCDNESYCSPGSSEIPSLPSSGDYIINTTYRMSDCASCEVSTERDVKVLFIVEH